MNKSEETTIKKVMVLVKISRGLFYFFKIDNIF